MITWRRLTEDDFGLLRHWLRQPHVARWWNHATTEEAVARDFGPAARGEEPSEDLLVFDDDIPVGLVQRSRYADYPEYIAELAPYLDVPPEAVTLDYLIGEAENTGKGLGPRMIQAIVTATWRDYPHAPAVIIPVPTANRRSWRALERAGFHRAAEAHLTPDNPADPPHHHVYRTNRPPHLPDPPR